MTDLYTSRWANKDLADLECVPVGISRGTPRFPVPYRYRLLRELAPNRDLFGLEPRDFEAGYRAQLDRLGVDAIVEKLRAISDQHDNRPLVLLCYEPADDFCHRFVFARWFEEKTGKPIPELQADDLPQRPDVPAPRLF